MKAKIKFPDFADIEVKASRPLWYVCQSCRAHYRAPADSVSPKCPFCGSWPTDDSCPGCCHSGMTFKPDDHQPDLPKVHGVLSCPVCGWFDDLALAEAYMVPE